ncbi:sodium:solute symporter family transporter [Schlesneria paludicola]|uniref:sodium:solute symporter family transporter n=1 Tax=Schlesneria paludicola TaxID=360056 RepID=UPI00029A4796|nr:Na+/solute symporter [Schlesneria paludicola]
MNSATLFVGLVFADVRTAPPPRNGLQWIDFLSVGAYLLVTIGIVYWSSRKSDTTSEFFLGGRRMPWMAVGLSVLATLMSSISYMGVPGEMIKNGVAMFAQYLALPFSMMVVLGVWVPFFMRLRFTSAYEYLERRFDVQTRVIGSLLFFLLRMGWMSMVTYVGSLALTQMLGTLVPAGMSDPLLSLLGGSPETPILFRETLLYWIVVVVGLSATVYSSVGGFRAAIWNDVLQSLMLFGGTIVTLGYVFWTTGTGPSDWWRIAAENSGEHTKPIIFSFDPTVRMTVVTAAMLSFFWTICTHGSDQVVLQRYFSTTSLKSARRSYIVAALTDLTIGVLLALSGLALLAFYLQHPSYLPDGIFVTENGHTVVKHGDRVLPHFFAHQLPAGIGGVILAVLLCDAMQTLVSGVNSISAVFAEDLYGRIRPDQKPLLSDVGFARFLSVIVGLAVTALATGVAYLAQHSGRNIIDMMAPAFNMFLGPLASLFLIGMFLKCDGRVAKLSVACSILISFLWSYWQILFGTSYQPSITLTTAVPYLAGFAIAALLGCLLKTPANHPGLAYTWSEVMKRPAPMSDD